MKSAYKVAWLVVVSLAVSILGWKTILLEKEVSALRSENTTSQQKTKMFALLRANGADPLGPSHISLYPKTWNNGQRVVKVVWQERDDEYGGTMETTFNADDYHMLTTPVYYGLR